MKIDTRRVTNDLFPSLRLVGRPKTSIYTRAEQLRINQKEYRKRKKMNTNIDNALSKIQAGFSTLELTLVLGIASALAYSTIDFAEHVENEALTYISDTKALQEKVKTSIYKQDKE